MLDFRSDTISLPTPAMRDVIRSAPVGDAVFNEDPSKTGKHTIVWLGNFNTVLHRIFLLSVVYKP